MQQKLGYVRYAETNSLQRAQWRENFTDEQFWSSLSKYESIGG
jgi:hypothetical protein